MCVARGQFDAVSTTTMPLPAGTVSGSSTGSSSVLAHEDGTTTRYHGVVGALINVLPFLLSNGPGSSDVYNFLHLAVWNSNSGAGPHALRLVKAWHNSVPTRKCGWCYWPKPTTLKQLRPYSLAYKVNCYTTSPGWSEMSPPKTFCRTYLSRSGGTCPGSRGQSYSGRGRTGLPFARAYSF